MAESPVVGRTYRVVYKDDAGTMALTGEYLGHSEMMGNHSLSLRPKAGTVTLRDSQVVGFAAAPPGVAALPHPWGIS